MSNAKTLRLQSGGSNPPDCRGTNHGNLISGPNFHKFRIHLIPTCTSRTSQVGPFGHQPLPHQQRRQGPKNPKNDNGQGGGQAVATPLRQRLGGGQTVVVLACFAPPATPATALSRTYGGLIRGLSRTCLLPRELRVYNRLWGIPAVPHQP